MNRDINQEQVPCTVTAFSFMTFAFAIVCGTALIGGVGLVSAESLAEVEEGNDPAVTATDASAPQVCIHDDQRAACQAQPGAMDYMPFKIRNESAGQCLRPSGGSTKEHAAIVLSDCADTKSRFWIQKRVPNGQGFQLENMKSGKCIQRVDSRLLQRTCELGGSTIRYQTWSFKETAPFGSGHFLRSWTGCASGLGNGHTQMEHCVNNANHRWYQTGS